MNEKIIKISDYWVWATISWRNIWNKIKNNIKTYFNMWIIINLNFDWVEDVTHSFIDEVIWTYIQSDFEKSVTNFKFTNCNDNIKSTIKFVFMDRKAKLKKELV